MKQKVDSTYGFSNGLGPICSIMILGIDPIPNVRYRISSIIAGDSTLKPNQKHVESTCVGNYAYMQS